MLKFMFNLIKCSGNKNPTPQFPVMKSSAPFPQAQMNQPFQGNHQLMFANDAFNTPQNKESRNQSMNFFNNANETQTNSSQSSTDL